MSLPLHLPDSVTEIIVSYWKPKTHYECVRETLTLPGSIWFESAGFDSAGWLHTNSGLIFMNDEKNVIKGNVISHSPQWKSFVVQNKKEALLSVVEWNGQLKQSFLTNYVLGTKPEPYFENTILYVSCLDVYETQTTNHGTFLCFDDQTLFEISLIQRTVRKISKYEAPVLHAGCWNETYYIEMDDFCIIRDSLGMEHKIGLHDDVVVEDNLVVTLRDDKITWYDGLNGWKSIGKQFKNVCYILLKDRYVFILFDKRLEIWTHEPLLRLYASVPIKHKEIFFMQLYSHGFIIVTDNGEFFYE